MIVKKCKRDSVPSIFIYLSKMFFLMHSELYLFINDSHRSTVLQSHSILTVCSLLRLLEPSLTGSKRETSNYKFNLQP